MKTLKVRVFTFAKLAVLAWSVSQMPVFADTMPLKYGDFYSHLKKLDKEDTPALQFAFGFVHVESKRLCHIEKVKIVTPKQTIDVNKTAENRFTLPTEKALKQARAIVEVTLDDNSHQCDMSVQLETKPDFLKKHYSQKELSELLNQYVTFFDDMGGFFSFLMPDVSGLTLHFSEHLPAQMIDQSGKSSGMIVTQRKISLTQQWLTTANNLTLPHKPLRITAITKND